MGDDLGTVVTKADDAPSLAIVLEQAAKDAVNSKLGELEKKGLLRRQRYPTITRKKIAKKAPKK